MTTDLWYHLNCTLHVSHQLVSSGFRDQLDFMIVVISTDIMMTYFLHLVKSLQSIRHTLKEWRQHCLNLSINHHKCLYQDMSWFPNKRGYYWDLTETGLINQSKNRSAAHKFSSVLWLTRLTRHDLRKTNLNPPYKRLNGPCWLEENITT